MTGGKMELWMTPPVLSEIAFSICLNGVYLAPILIAVVACLDKVIWMLEDWLACTTLLTLSALANASVAASNIRLAKTSGKAKVRGAFINKRFCRLVSVTKNNTAL
jgi:hypothetical protein